MGETSAKSLRGGSMKDVIFSGCDTRKASTFAEVSIELDNTKRVIKSINEDTVLITRKAQVNGKSFFYINEQPALLKDIQELFLDTGLGSNSYSMIGQEQTKKLLSEKNDERRAIFEEASGIEKMKNQKETSEKNLLEIEKNYTRLKDILKELKRQVEPLQKQSERAKKYVSIKDILDEKEINFLSNKLQRINKEQLANLEILNDKRETLESSIQLEVTTNERFKSSKESLRKLNENIFAIQDTKSELKVEIDRYVNETKMNEERISQLTEELTDINNEISDIEQKFSVSTDDFNNKKNRSKELESLILSYKNRKEQIVKEIFHSQFEITNSRNKAEELRQLITSLYNESQEMKLRFEQHNREEEEILKEQDLNKEKKKEINTSLDLAKRNIINKENEVKTSAALFNDISIEYQSTLNDIELLNEKLKIVQSQLSTLEKEMYRNSATLESLESSLENFDGYYEGVKQILKNKSKMNGIIDVVSNLFEVQDGFESAFDSLLSAVTQNIVVNSIDSAKNAVKFLKDNRFGRATFIPLNDLTPKFFSKEELVVIKEYENISPALSVITYDERLTQLFQHLAGRYLVAKNMDAAVEFYKETKFRTKIVTLDGDILQPGVISGGTRNKKGLISKKKDLTLLKEQINKSQLAINSNQVTEKQISDQLYKLTDRKELLYTEIEKNKEINNTLSFELEHLKRELNHMNENEKNLNLTCEDLLYRFNESKKISSSLFTKQKEKEQLYNQKNEELTKLLDSIRVQENSFNSLKEEETTILIENEKSEEEKRNLLEFISEQENGKDSYRKRLEFLQEKKETSIKKQQRSSESIHSLEEDLKKLQNEYSLTENHLNKTQSEKELAESTMDKTESELSKLRAFVTTLNEEVHKLELTETNFTNEREKILKQSLERYHLTETDLLNYETSPMDETKTEKEINALYKEIKSIGPVNLESIKDFDELHNRYKKEKEQLDDIEEAKKDLESLLKDVTKEMTDRFNSTFKDIANHFEKTFVELFGGGKAKLSLEEPNKPLTSHITIVAQPPGKKPRRIESLSGGEKNLTVCALIFAILKAKPSPFVYLDEIDAPLDDANISRFADCLKKFSTNTQFIVVTHRKGTMMAADSLYGVTQEELGVTTVFPYQLEQDSERKVQ